jgi:hypothetical protein
MALGASKLARGLWHKLCLQTSVRIQADPDHSECDVADRLPMRKIRELLRLRSARAKSAGRSTSQNHCDVV